jgi:hypothetical protein
MKTLLNYFEINNNNGSVIVHSSLDREVADKITLVLTVEDLNAVNGSMQTATGKLYYLIYLIRF